MSTVTNNLEVLKGPFDIELHKKTFVNYLEIIIHPDGLIEYAVPSHSEKLLQVYMNQNNIDDRGEALRRISEAVLLKMDTYGVDALCELTGCVSVWNDGYYGKANQKQINKLKTLKLSGLYHGAIKEPN